MFRNSVNSYNNKTTSNKVVVYTDGACRGNQSNLNVGAWAFYIAYNGQVYKNCYAVRNTTNNIMEMTAIIQALRSIDPSLRNLPIEVYSDSNYCIQGLNTWRHGWKKKGWRKSDNKPVENMDLWKELDGLTSMFPNIRFIKVKGHSGNVGNEEVDRLCNVAMDRLNYAK